MLMTMLNMVTNMVMWLVLFARENPCCIISSRNATSRVGDPPLTLMWPNIWISLVFEKTVTDLPTDGRMDRRTDGKMDGRMERWTDG